MDSFFKQGILVGLLNLEKGFLFTLKSLLTRPGYAIREYLEGKRVGFINFFTFLLLFASINYIISQFLPDFSFDSDLVAPNNISSTINKLIKKHQKLILILVIPLVSLLTYWFFRKSKLTFAEHIVLNTYKAAGQLFINIVTSIGFFFTTNSTLFLSIGLLASTLSIFYKIWLNHQFFKQDGYKFFGTLIKTLFSTAVVLMIIMISVLVVLLVTHQIPIPGSNH